MGEVLVKKVTFNRDLTDKDYRDLREMLGDKIVQEGTRYVVVAFDNGMDYLAFMVVVGHVTMIGMDGRCL